VTDSSEQPAPGADAAEPVEQAPAPAPEQPAEARPPVYPEGWTDEDTRIVDMIRTLAMDAVQKTGNGHPGTAMSLAPAAYTLFQRIMRHDPADPNWLGRDRFVLSAGHSSLTLYIQLYLSGYGLELDDLKALRTWGSLTPGHPEHGHTAGVETTTGPLGQGVGNAVGFAMAARRERGLLDPDAAPGESVFDHRIFVICSDGDMEEGVSGEASSLAGPQRTSSSRSPRSNVISPVPGAHSSTRVTRQPPAARAATVAAPMPRAAPVTSATRPVTATDTAASLATS